MIVKLSITLGILAVASTWAAPPEGAEWVSFEPMTDEFNGDSLDLKKWYDHNPTWSGRPPSLFHRDCVSVSNGLLRIEAMDSKESALRKLPKEFSHISGFVRSKQQARFGYFEMRAKLMDSTQVSCFWLTSVEKDEWSEIDVIEVPAGIEKYASTLRPNVHYFHGPHYRGTLHKHKVSPSSHELGFNMSEAFHVYGVEWTPTVIRWYVDGKMIREMHNADYFQPLEMNMNIEANDYFGALPDDASLPAFYEIDFVRTWRRKEY